MNVALLNRSVRAMQLNQMRQFSVAFNVKSKFEQAYQQKMEGLKKIPEKV